MIKKGSRVYVKQNFKANPFRAKTKIIKKEKFLEIDPSRSKIAAGVAKGFSSYPDVEDSVLYLGASAGYTTSFMAHECKAIFAVELSPIMSRDLILNTEEIANVVPICASASTPMDFSYRVALADFIFQDISQRDQLLIFRRNVELYLKEGAIAVIAIKARSIDATKDPSVIYKQALDELNSWAIVIESVELDPFEKDHLLVAIQKG